MHVKSPAGAAAAGTGLAIALIVGSCTDRTATAGAAPAARTVRLYADTASGTPTFLSPVFLDNRANREDLTVGIRQEFWNGSQPNCGPPNEETPDVQNKRIPIAGGTRRQLGCSVVPAGPMQSCSWHLRFSCLSGNAPNCRSE
jgi:hypothetical protein